MSQAELPFLENSSHACGAWTWRAVPFVSQKTIQRFAAKWTPKNGDTPGRSCSAARCTSARGVPIFGMGLPTLSRAGHSEGDSLPCPKPSSHSLKTARTPAARGHGGLSPSYPKKQFRGLRRCGHQKMGTLLGVPVQQPGVRQPGVSPFFRHGTAYSVPSRPQRRGQPTLSQAELPSLQTARTLRRVDMAGCPLRIPKNNSEVCGDVDTKKWGHSWAFLFSS